MKKSPSADFNNFIGNILRFGVTVSGILVGIGILMILLGYTPNAFPSSLPQLVSANFGRPTLSLRTLAYGLARFDPIYIIQLGLLILLSTPIARVLASIFLFVAEKDRIYVALTLFVLLVLLFSIFVVGPIEAAA